jgi:predicted O-methyltransferase YrrM
MKTITELMMKIEDVVPKLEGWCDVYKAQHLAAMVISMRPKVTVEIGVFGGRSLCPISMAHSFIEYGYALGIDPWAKSASLDGMDGENKQWWDNLDHDAIYSGFMSASARLRADGFMKVERMTSNEAVHLTPNVIDLLHIDGNHGPQAIADVDNYATRLRAGGILVMDDVDWAAPAVTQINALGFRHLYQLGTGAVFQR